MNKTRNISLIFLILLIVIASSACDQRASAIEEPFVFVATPVTQEVVVLKPATQAEPALAGTTSPIPSPTQTLDPAKMVLIPLLPEAIAQCIPAGAEQVTASVVKVIDGDDILVDIRGKQYDVRYNGIDTPDSPEEYYKDEVLAKNRELVEGKTVLLIKDGVEADEWGRLERYVFVGNHFINMELVAEGYAWAMETRPGLACLDAFLVAEREAEQRSAGMWAGIRRLTATPTP